MPLSMSEYKAGKKKKQVVIKRSAAFTYLDT